MPEARIILAQAVTYVASAPKSNSAITAIDEAMESVRNEKISGIPTHLQDAHYKSASKLGHGVGYQYAHAFPNHYVEQQYLPDELVGRAFTTLQRTVMRRRFRNILRKFMEENKWINGSGS